MFISSNSIQKAVDKKNGSDLRDIADASFSPNDWADECAASRMSPAFICSVAREFLRQGVRLSRTLAKRRKQLKSALIYHAQFNDAYGVCTVYFVGTVNSILKRLDKLGNDNFDPGT